MKNTITTLVLLASLTSCTRNSATRTFGGTKIINLQSGETVTQVTWKDNNLWYATAPRLPGVEPRQTVFREDSQWGIAEGKVIFNER